MHLEMLNLMYTVLAKHTTKLLYSFTEVKQMTDNSLEKKIGLQEMKIRLANKAKENHSRFQDDGARKYLQEVLTNPQYDLSARKFAALKLNRECQERYIRGTPSLETCNIRAERYLIAGQKDQAAKEYLLAAAIINPESYDDTYRIHYANRNCRDELLQKALKLYREINDVEKIKLVDFAIETGNNTGRDAKWRYYQRKFERMFATNEGKLTNKLVVYWLANFPQQYHTILGDNVVKPALYLW